MRSGLIAFAAMMLPKLLGDAFSPVIGTLLVVEVLVVIGYCVRVARASGRSKTGRRRARTE